MKFEEALPLMRQGRKFRRKSWLDESWVGFVDDDVLIDEGNEVIRLSGAALLADDWEEVQTPWREELKDGSFAEALVGMMHGETWARASGSFVLSLENDKEEFGIDDLTATDWERVV